MLMQTEQLHMQIISLDVSHIYFGTALMFNVCLFYGPSAGIKGNPPPLPPLLPDQEKNS